MRIDPSGIPFIAGALVPAVVLVCARRPLWAAPPAVLAAFFLFFFRDPERRAPPDPHVVLAPADGRVLVAGSVTSGNAPAGVWQQVSIFLSPLDVHVNRTPVSGHVTRVEYHPGRFLPAYRPDASENERTEVWIERDGQRVVFRQIVGILARRIVCRLAPGDEVRAGDRCGIMKFGSRMDVFVPPDAELLVRVGEHVRGGETILARFRRAAGTSR
jgi:phosphatidylserine decarboxylase